MPFRKAISAFLLGSTLITAGGCQILAIIPRLWGKVAPPSTSSKGVGISSDVPDQPDPTAPRRSPTAEDPP